MHRFIDREDRMQRTLLPNSLEDYVDAENPVRMIEVFIDELDLAALGFSGMTPAARDRPAYHPSTLLKIYLYGYLNRVQSSRRLEREAQRNIELMWLTGRLAPDFKTIADFRKDNGARITARRSGRGADSSSSFAVGSSFSLMPLLLARIAWSVLRHGRAFDASGCLRCAASGHRKSGCSERTERRCPRRFAASRSRRPRRASP
jgi:transposase